MYHSASHLSYAFPCADTEQDQQQKQQDTVSPRPDARCSSTLPYAVSRWPERSETRLAEDATKKNRLKSASDSSVASRSSPVEVRRKLSLLEEKRAIFQRRFFDSSRDTQSDDTLVAVSVDGGEGFSVADESLERREEERKKKTRQISVRTFDTFSTFDSAFDEDTGYLRGIEEDYTESYDREDGKYSSKYAMAPMVGAAEHHPEKVRACEQDGDAVSGLGIVSR